VRPFLKINPSQKGLVEWLKMKALSSNPSNAKKKKLPTHIFIFLVVCVLGLSTALQGFSYKFVKAISMLRIVFQ
jgi:hypothetical protein